MLPWAISLAMAAIVWEWSFNPDYGMINRMLLAVGLIRAPVHWMARADTAFPVEIAIGILVSIPFSTTIFQGGLVVDPHRYLRGRADRRCLGRTAVPLPDVCR